VEDADASPAGYFFLETLNSVTFGIVKMQSAACDGRYITSPLSELAGQWNHHVMHKVCISERIAVWQQRVKVMKTFNLDLSTHLVCRTFSSNGSSIIIRKFVQELTP
jgi:hypothetical protein